MKFCLFVLLSFSLLQAHGQFHKSIHLKDKSIIRIKISDIDSSFYTNIIGGPTALVTLPMQRVAQTNATAFSNITNNGGTSVIQRGFCWSIKPSPTTKDQVVVAGDGIGSYNALITTLLPSTTYYLRSYAINNYGTTYGNEISFTTLSINQISNHFSPLFEYGTVTDIDNNSYKTIQVGTQTWMAENLRVTRYSNGVAISNVVDNTQWANNISGAWCYNNHDQSNNIPFGKLYNWYAAVNSNNICPTGWHVPTDGDWNILIQHLDLSYIPFTNDVQSSIAGGKMKSTGLTYWIEPNQGANNLSGLSALPNGDRIEAGQFVASPGQLSYWWSSSQSSSTTAVNRVLIYSNGNMNRFSANMARGLAIRCIKDDYVFTSASQFNQNLTYGIVKDVDNNSYRTIQIGRQTWMAENLRVTKYRNGIAIPNITNSTTWNNNYEGAWTYYNNDESKNIPYGKLYNWYAATNTNGICPQGWHLPSDNEWNVLIGFLDPTYKPSVEGSQSTIAGGRIKSPGTIEQSTGFWLSPNQGATNSVGFSALGAGSAFPLNNNLGQRILFWSSTEGDANNAWIRGLFYQFGDVYRQNFLKTSGFSIRCIRDFAP